MEQQYQHDYEERKKEEFNRVSRDSLVLRTCKQKRESNRFICQMI